MIADFGRASRRSRGSDAAGQVDTALPDGGQDEQVDPKAEASAAALIGFAGVAALALHYGMHWLRFAQLKGWSGPDGAGYWGMLSNNWDWGLLAVALAGFGVIKSGLTARTRLTLLVLVFAAGIAVEGLSLNPYLGIADGQVVVHPEPGATDLRFALADATVVERKCTPHRTSSRTRYRVTFRVRPPGAGEATIDLGGDVDSWNAGRWLAAMRGYTSGRLPLPAGTAPGSAYTSICVARLGSRLDADQTAQLRRLVE